MREIASYIADQPPARFPQYEAAVEQFRQKLFNGAVADVLTALTTATDGGSVASDEPDLERDLQPADSDVEPDDPPVDADLELDVQPADSYIEPDNQPADAAVEPVAGPSSPADIIFEAVPRARGRPAAVRQRPFKVFGRKRKHDQVDSAAVEASKCAECSLSDPPANARRKKHTIEWLQCDRCDLWYHLQCTRLKRKPASSAQYHCTNCIADDVFALVSS